MIDIVAEIRRANAGRDPERLALKYRAMREDPFAFLRGSCALFYRRMPRGGVHKSAPVVWVCGDLHLENFGSYRGHNGLAYFDINDFDESALAPATWDLVRILTSVSVGAATLGFGAAHADRLAGIFVDAYATALAAGKAYWIERDTASGAVRKLLDAVSQRKRAEFLDGRTAEKDGKRRLRTDNGKALPADKAQRAAVKDFMRGFAAAQPEPDFYRVLDVARRVAGTGSLGVERYVVLVRGKGSPDENHLLDLKIAAPSALLATLKTAQPRWKTAAERVAGVQQRLQAVPVAFLEPVHLDGRPFVLRALQPAQDRIDLRRADMDELERLVGTMGQIVAWSQLRSAGRDGSATADALIGFGRRKKWRAALLDAARDGAAQVTRDAAAFDKAFDDGAFAAPRRTRGR